MSITYTNIQPVGFSQQRTAAAALQFVESLMPPTIDLAPNANIPVDVKACDRCGMDFIYRKQGTFPPKYCLACLKR